MMERRFERALLAAIVTGFATAYALYGLFRHWHFGSSAYDLGIFDQVVWHLSRFEAPASSINGFANIFGDHFHPVIALFAPLYWIAPTPATLIVVQAVLVAASAIPVYLFTRHRLPPGPSLALTVAYCACWGLQRTVAFDVHEVAFAPLAIATAIYAMDARRWRLFWVSALGLILIKEDLIPLIPAFGLYLLATGERARGLIAVAVGAIGFAIVVLVIIPALNEAGRYAYASSYVDLLDDPLRIPRSLITPPAKLRTVALWFAPFAFLSLASPLSLLTLPVALSRLLSDSPNHWSAVFHYAAPLAPIVAMSAADGIARLTSRHPGRTFPVAAAAACVVLSAFLPGRQPLWRVFAPGHYRSTPFNASGRTAVGMIPAGASVVAQAAIVPHLSQRTMIRILDDSAPDGDYVVASADLNPWPAANGDGVRAWIAACRLRGYVVVFEKDGWVVLRPPGALASPTGGR